MIRVLPDWYGEAEDLIRKALLKIIDKNNINFSLVNDSQLINSSIDNILNKLVFISEMAEGNWSKEEFEDVKELQKAIKNENNKNKKN